MIYHYVRRYIKNNGATIDAGVVEIPDKYLESTLKNNPLWKLESSFDPSNSHSSTASIQNNKIVCPLCTPVKEFQSDRLLAMHKGRFHK